MKRQIRKRFTAQTILNKNFNEAVEAQRLLEVAKKKMENATDQTISV